MTTAPMPQADIVSTVAPQVQTIPPVERQVAEIQALLQELEAISSCTHPPPVLGDSIDDKLVRTRLGAAAGLFAALQCRDPARAGHALRVALCCSAWAVEMDLSVRDRKAIEVAALLHDVGVIGAPDHILLKHGALNHNEAAVMFESRKMSLDILRRGGLPTDVLEIVKHIPVWFDGSRPATDWAESSLDAGYGAENIPEPTRQARGTLVHGQQIPLGSRMIAIAEAFDAMTTDHVYRPAWSQEQAMAELFACSGSQFDPALVRHFAEFWRGDHTEARWQSAHRWLRSLDADPVGLSWQSGASGAPAEEAAAETIFRSRLLDNMYDAVVFIDAAGRVVQWNRGAERMTGIIGSSVCGRLWQPNLLGMADEKGREISETDCPVNTAIRCGVQSLRRLHIIGRGQRAVAVDTHTIPVIDAHGISRGAILLFHDASSETSLEQRCQSLHEKATKDPLTQVANRAEFDRVHATFVAAHQQQQVPCSLLMCDLDRFKQVNDTYGHQAGDEVIQCLASLMKSSCRPGDLVARYGGEEFVLLCADCDNASAARRAEEIRQALAKIAQPMLNGRTVTVSFGVTEIQPGDTPETMLRRADRALLMAKARGRNNVVQLGSGSSGNCPQPRPASWLFRSTRPKQCLQQDLVTPVPIKIAVEKLRGFMADHKAKIVAVEGNEVRMEIEDQSTGRLRRITDRSLVFTIDISLEEERLQTAAATTGGATTRTRIHVSVNPRRNRDRRRNDVIQRAREVLVSFRSYMMACEEEPLATDGALRRTKRLLTSWLR